MSSSTVLLLDADLLDHQSKQPNLSLMKLSGYHKSIGDLVYLARDWEDLLYGEYDEAYIAKVFDFTRMKVPTETILEMSRSAKIKIGGTGFFFVAYWPGNILMLDEPVEHHMPDYHLYDGYVADMRAAGVKAKSLKEFTDFSYGFTTRGCFRHCKFCVNQLSSRVNGHSPVSEFLDPDRKRIYLLDDNILGYGKWREVFAELADTGKAFQYRQGMDIRLMTDEKAQVLAKARYYGDYTFAFDDLKDRDEIEKGIQIWRRHYDGNTRLYVLSGFGSQDEKDIESVFERIRILMQYKCLPYIMRHKKYLESPYKGMYINLASWCNQPALFKKMSFWDFCNARGRDSSLRYAKKFADEHRDIADKYYDMRWNE